MLDYSGDIISNIPEREFGALTISRKFSKGQHLQDIQGEAIFKDDNNSDDDGVPNSDQQGIATPAVGTSTSRVAGSSIVVGSASSTGHSGFLRF